jgi:transposase
MTPEQRQKANIKRLVEGGIRTREIARLCVQLSAANVRLWLPYAREEAAADIIPPDERRAWTELRDELEAMQG